VTVGAVSRRMFFCLVAMVALAGAPSQGQPAKLRVAPLAVVTAKGVFHFQVEVAGTDEARERGLMFRKSLGPDQGMLFNFRTPQSVAFWMKNTLIPLDIVFVGKDGHIVSIARQATPLSESPIPSGGDVLGVVEIKGGRAAEIGAQPGDVVENEIFRR